MKTKLSQFIKGKYFEYFLLSIVLIAGFGVRLYKIGSPIADWHSWRQADTASVSRIYVKEGINLLVPRYDDISSVQTGFFNPEGLRMVEFPFYNALNAVLAGNFTFISLEIWARLITIFCALTTAFFLFLIGKRFLGSAGGILAAFFYLFIPFNIYFTRVILPDPMGVTFGVIGLWAFLKFIEDRVGYALYISAAFFAAMLLIKPYFGFYLFPVAYLSINKFGVKKFLKDKKIILHTILFFLVTFLPFLLWRIWTQRFPEGIPFYQWAFNGNLIRFKPSWWYWIFGERLGHLILGSLGIIPFALGVLNTKVKSYFIHSFLAGVLFYVAAVASANVMHDYYQIITMPAIALTLAAGSVFLWKAEVFNKTLSRIVLVISVFVMLITGWNQIKGNYAINHPEIIEAGKEVAETTPKDALIVAPYMGDTAFLYQTERRGWPAIDDSIDNIIAKGATHYVSVDQGSPDSKMIMSRFKTIKKTDRFIIVDLQKPL